jgi:hypothetical protein
MDVVNDCREAKKSMTIEKRLNAADQFTRDRQLASLARMQKARRNPAGLHSSARKSASHRFPGAGALKYVEYYPLTR